MLCGSGVKHLSRTDSRPVTWVIKIKHAGLGVLGHFRIILNYLGGWARQFTSSQARKPTSLTRLNSWDSMIKNRKDNMPKTITLNKAVERMITAVNIVTGDDGHRSQEAVKTFIELLKMEEKDYAKQQQYYG